MSAARSHRLAPEGFDAAFRPHRRRLIGAFAVLIAAVLVAFPYLRAGRPPGPRDLVALPLMTFVAAVAIRRTTRKQRAVWESYELVVRETGLVRRQAGALEVSIRRDAIAAVEETGRGGLIVRAVSGERIVIPAALVGFAEVHGRIASWRRPGDGASAGGAPPRRP